MWWLRQRMYPELAHFDAKERIRVLSSCAMRASWEAKPLVRTSLLMVTYFAVLLVLMYIFMKVVWGRSGVSRVILGGAYMFLVSLAFGFLIGWIQRGAVRRLLRESLDRRGIPICADCCYDLRGLAELRCPECGRPFEQSMLEGRPPA